MKTTNKITLLSLAGGLTLVGTAFAAWQFNANVAEAQNSNVEITKVTNTGSIADVATFYLTLDQKGAYWTNKSFVDSDDEITDADIVESFEFTYTGSANSNDVSDVTLSVSYEVDSAISEYVTVSGGELGEATVLNNVKSATYTLPSLAYTANKPTTLANYNAMKDALEGKTITFSLVATVA